MKTAVRKHGTSGNCRISLFGTLVGWLHEQSYIPRARKGLNSGQLFLNKEMVGRVYEATIHSPRAQNNARRNSHLVFLILPIVMQAIDLYLVVMSRIFNGRALQLNARMAKGDGHAYVPLETVAPVVEELLPVMDEVRLERMRGEGNEGVTLSGYYNDTNLTWVACFAMVVFSNTFFLFPDENRPCGSVIFSSAINA